MQYKIFIVMKGQLVFEFLVAVMVFFGIVLYSLNYLSWTVSGYSSGLSMENMESKASQIGEVLVMNEGKWAGGNPVVMGLAKDWPVLNSTKISWLNSSCNNDYGRFSDKLGMQPKHRVKITISETQADGTVLVRAECMWGQAVPGYVNKAEAKRYALSESGNVLTVYVLVWTTGK